MNSQELADLQELAVYHLAEAERHERMAHAERMKAVKHLAAAQLEFNRALKSAKENQGRIRENKESLI